MRFAATITALLVIALPASAEIPCGTPGVTARVDPEVAVPGESILVTLTNGSSSDITFNNSCLFDAVYAAGEIEPIVWFFCSPVITTIAPGGSMSESWNQEDNNGDQVPNGEYFVFIPAGSFANFCAPMLTIAEGVPALTGWGTSVLIALSGLAGIWALRRRSMRRV
jgi:hypothetical protein